MNWTGLQQLFAETYKTVSEWVYTHPLRTDIVIGLAVLGGIAYLLSRRGNARRRARHIRWGVRMVRSKNREAFEKSLISYGITDAIEEAVYRGDMTPERAKHWYDSFANYYQMDELRPRKDKDSVKKSIRRRINTGIHRIKAIIPGIPPLPWKVITGEEKVKGVDSNYKPVHEAPKLGTKRSKYATAA